jgi:hypothetical protein
MTANWTQMRPGHFDTSLLPKTRKAPQGQFELFAVADIAVAPAPKTESAPEADGQLGLFGEDML